MGTRLHWAYTPSVSPKRHRFYRLRLRPCIWVQCKQDINEAMHFHTVKRETSLRFTSLINRLRPRQNGSHFADNIFKWIFLNENVWIPIKTSLKFVPQGPINNIPALVQIMAWRRPGDKPLSGPMTVSLTTHICVTRPQWVKHKRDITEDMYLSLMQERNNCI